MLINMLKSKIHRATVTDADLNYVGSITISVYTGLNREIERAETFDRSQL